MKYALILSVFLFSAPLLAAAPKGCPKGLKKVSCADVAKHQKDFFCARNPKALKQKAIEKQCTSGNVSAAHKKHMKKGKRLSKRAAKKKMHSEDPKPMEMEKAAPEAKLEGEMDSPAEMDSEAEGM